MLLARIFRQRDPGKRDNSFWLEAMVEFVLVVSCDMAVPGGWSGEATAQSSGEREQQGRQRLQETQP